MGFFEKLYDGELYPAEEIMDEISGSEEYLRYVHKLSEVSGLLENQLTGETLRAYLQYRDTQNALMSFMEAQAFKLGFSYGAEFRASIPPRKPPRPDA